MTEILYNISLDEFKNRLKELSKNQIIIVRFTAEWCSPCQLINNDCDEYFKNCNKNIQPIVIDIEESIDLYVIMKRYKMVTGIPTLLAYYGDDNKDHWYIPTKSIVGGNKKNLLSFFNECSIHVNKYILG